MDRKSASPVTCLCLGILVESIEPAGLVAISKAKGLVRCKGGNDMANTGVIMFRRLGFAPIELLVGC